LKDFLKKYLPEIISVILFLVSLIFLTMASDQKTVGYDCQLAEISPDIPLAIKNACREARGNK
jgi:hypothetical protein